MGIPVGRHRLSVGLRSGLPGVQRRKQRREGARFSRDRSVQGLARPRVRHTTRRYRSTSQPHEPPAPAEPFADLPHLLALAAHDNVAVKISGACTLSREPFPYKDI